MSSTPPRSPPLQEQPPPHWGESLADGAAGISLVHIDNAHAGLAGWDTVHRWTTAMTRQPITATPDTGLYRGVVAVAFTLTTAGHPAYAKALDTMDGQIDVLTRHRLERAHGRIDSGQPPPLGEFDLISGLTGIGMYLSERERHTDLLREVLSYLVRLTAPLTINNETLPGWWTANGPDDRCSPYWPGGHANFGIAHGISGPLALLATTLRRGTTVPGQADALNRICRRLDQWRCGTSGRPWWPGMISLTEWRTGTVNQPGPQRPSWCYGTPGLARAQQLAALALREPTRQQAAEQALVACVTDEAQLSQLDNPSLCHGLAGLLQTTSRAAYDAHSDAGLAPLVTHLRTRLDQHLHRHGPPDQDGLLQGQAGIDLARRTTTAASPASRWDNSLLLAG